MPDPNGEPEPTQVYDAKTRSGTPYQVKLTPTDARRLGLTGDSDERVADASGEQAEGVARPADDDAPAKARGDASNKARTTSSKS